MHQISATQEQASARGTRLAADNLNAKLCGLMQSVQAGDKAAYAELLFLALPIIKRVAGSQRYRSLETDDIVQETLLSLHSVRHTYDPSRPFIPWLASIVHHRSIDAYRRRARISRNEVSVPEFPETFQEAETKWNLEGEGDPELLRRAIMDLPPGQRHAVELLKIKQLSLKEASAASGMTIAALKVASHRGIKALRLRLTGQRSETNEKSE
jgi:RNA polymerase sigma-70 factor (ECF subfamily)